MNILIWGCGHMGAALALGLRRAFPGVKIVCWNPSIQKAKALAEKVAGEIFQPAEQDLSQFDVVVLGCKPQKLAEVAMQLRGTLSSQVILLSPLAAVNIEKLKQSFNVERVLRVMPNLQIAYGTGLLLWASEGIGSSELVQWKTGLGQLGRSYLLTEDLIDLYTIHAACSPAFLLYWMFKSAQFAEKHGGEANLALELLAQSWKGILDQLGETKTEEIPLRIKEIASQGGITEACLKTFELSSPTYIDKAFEAGILRVKELQSSANS